MIFQRYYGEFLMKIKITDQYIRSMLIFNKKHTSILVSLYELKLQERTPFLVKSFPCKPDSGTIEVPLSV